MSIYSPSPLDILVARTKLPWHWFVVIVGLILFIPPLVVAYIDGFWSEFLYEGTWRTMLLAPAIVIYILVIYHPMEKFRAHAIKSFRQLVLLDDEEFNNLVQLGLNKPTITLPEPCPDKSNEKA